ncbi:UNVERIFIED_CONTAM: hypothetical protein GTU68_029119 [Idotea baltica]|nr:hypothetical protein [Idotea baltica]
MGHMLNNTIQDILIRRKRMEGFNACWVPGMDHASIATEAKVVRMLREDGIKKSDLTRDEFLAHAFDWKDKYGGIILSQLRKLGCSCDWDRTRFTMDDDYYQAVIQVFCDLFEKGYIYRDLRMVNWDPVGLTALSDEEVIYKEKQGKLYQVRYQIEGSEDEWVTIATTRPETILGDTAISVNPDDERYKHLVGKKAMVPLLNRAIPIIADDYVDVEFGTGCLKVTPAHDINDYEIGQRHNLETIDILNANGTLSEEAQLYIGEDRFIARKKIVKDLKAAGHLVQIDDYTNQVGHSERTDAIIEPRLSLQWWVKMGDFSKPAYEAVMDDTVQLIPPKFKNTYRHWMENIKDWCISRQLWWGQQIPAYFLESERELLESERQYFVAPTPEGALEKDADVLDTWFSSWLWPFQVFRSLTDPGNAEANYYYPTNDLVTGPDILFFWVARMVIAGYEYQQERPFNNVYLTGLIRDEKGRKMSKSLGNSPDPLELMKIYGADGVRVGVLMSSPAGNNNELKSKLCEQGRNFCNKIWNASRLVKGWEIEASPAKEIETLAIGWIKNRIEDVKVELADHFSKFRISDALRATYKLIWDDFCSWFLEMVKPPRGAGMSKSSYEAIIDIFSELMEIAHPFIPFISEEVWQSLKDRPAGSSIMITQLSPTDAAAADQELLRNFDFITRTITAIRRFRAEKGIKNSETIDLYVNTSIPDVISKHKPILDKFLNLAQLNFAEEGPSRSGTVMVDTTKFFIPLPEMDLDAERAKIEEEMNRLQGFMKGVMKKLGNERFVANAKPEVVALEQKKKADTEEKLKLLQEALSSLS